MRGPESHGYTRSTPVVLALARLYSQPLARVSSSQHRDGTTERSGLTNARKGYCATFKLRALARFDGLLAHDSLRWSRGTPAGSRRPISVMNPASPDRAGGQVVLALSVRRLRGSRPEPQARRIGYSELVRVFRGRVAAHPLNPRGYLGTEPDTQCLEQTGRHASVSDYATIQLELQAGNRILVSLLVLNVARSGSLYSDG